MIRLAIVIFSSAISIVTGNFWWIVGGIACYTLIGIGNIWLESV